MDNISPIFPFFPPMKLTYFYYLHSFLEKYFHQHAGHRTDFDRPREIESTLSLSIPTSTQCTMDIFSSKSGHLSNRIIVSFLLIFSKKIAVFDDFSKWRVPNVQQKSEKIIKCSKNLGEMKKTLQFLLLYI